MLMTSRDAISLAMLSVLQKFIPFFQPENLEKNKKLLARVARIAEEKSCSTNQLALAWVIHKGAPFTVPIPGTTKLTNLTSNVGAVAVELRPDEMRALEEAIPVDEVAGSRYGNVTREEQAAFLEEAHRLARSSTI